MGIPRFYRWISERYPKINQVVTDSSFLPEFDNLYLDMNGIIHGCSHSNDGSVAQLDEREFFMKLFQYVDRIVTRIVRPQNLLYMAIDGVAPRAKMNQQRSRRFKSSKDASEGISKAVKKKKVQHSNEIFDSNCITPGTEFMEKVSEHLKYFIRKKIKEDQLWQNIKVIFSGAEVPGEGEHKIMSYIREQRHKNLFSPNTRHCMYGQDADLIMLGLVTHEPHFILLREVVNFQVFAKSKKNAPNIVLKDSNDVNFQLLHLSILREYLWIEFTMGVPQQLSSNMSLERIVDDFIFISLFIGNDFLPSIHCLDISEEAFDLLFSIYKTVFINWNGDYLTKDGDISSPERLEEFLKLIGEKENQIITARIAKKKNKVAMLPKPSEDNVEVMEEQQLSTTVNQIATDSSLNESQFRDTLYSKKFGFLLSDHNKIQDACAQYIAGLKWCLAYYFRGCISWSWFYPFHYAPMIIDLIGLKELMSKVTLTLDGPFLPFEQLLACLPPASAHCLPEIYAALMARESPIMDFYPLDFKIDLNGKKNSWEGVALLPFIDAKRLFEAVKQYCPNSKLSAAQKKRNTFGKVYQYQYCPTSNEYIPSCNQNIGLKQIISSNSIETLLSWTIHPSIPFNSCLPPGTLLPYPGFPSLNFLEFHEAEVSPIGINIFGIESKYSTLTLSLKAPKSCVLNYNLASSILGHRIFVNGPFLHEAEIVRVSNIDGEFLRSKNGKIVQKMFSPTEVSKWQQKMSEEKSAYLKGRRVPGSGGIHVGDIDVSLSVTLLQGMKMDNSTGAVKKVFGSDKVEIPFQLALWRSPVIDRRFTECAPQPVYKRFPVNCKVLCLVNPKKTNIRLKGCLGTVENVQHDLIDVSFDLRPFEQPFSAHVVDLFHENYVPAYIACKKVKLKPDIFGKVVGSLKVNPGKYDIGLNLKANGRYQLPGYCRCRLDDSKEMWKNTDAVRIEGFAGETLIDNEIETKGWEFSKKAIDLGKLLDIFNYKQHYPQLFTSLEKIGHDKIYNVNDLFGDECDHSILEKIKDWLESLHYYELPRLPLTSTMLSKEAVREIEFEVRSRRDIARSKKTMTRLFDGFKPDELLQFDANRMNSSTFTHNRRPELGERVVSVFTDGVPFGAWGTVIACHYHSSSVEVVFDEEFIGGGTLNGICSNYKGLLVPWATVLNVYEYSEIKVFLQRKDSSNSTSRKSQNNKMTFDNTMNKPRNERVNTTVPTPTILRKMESFHGKKQANNSKNGITIKSSDSFEESNLKALLQSDSQSRLPIPDSSTADPKSVDITRKYIQSNMIDGLWSSSRGHGNASQKNEEYLEYLLKRDLNIYESTLGHELSAANMGNTATIIYKSPLTNTVADTCQDMDAALEQSHSYKRTNETSNISLSTRSAVSKNSTSVSTNTLKNHSNHNFHSEDCALNFASSTSAKSSKHRRRTKKKPYQEKGSKESGEFPLGRINGSNV